MTAPAATPADVAAARDALRDHIARRVRWVAHTATGPHLTPTTVQAAEQVAAEIVDAYLAQIGGER